MTLTIQSITVDADDPGPVATFWQHALGWRRTHEDDEEIVLEPPAGSPQDGVAPDLLVVRVPEVKTVKNRVHLDLRPSGSMAEEVERLRTLGASVGELVEVPASALDGQPSSWTVMGDPEGNEFCVLRGPGDGWRADAPLG